MQSRSREGRGGWPGPRLAAPCERLDDEHAAAAAWAWTRKRRRLGCVSRFGIVRDRVRLRKVQQRTRFGDVVGAATVGQEPVVADAMEAFRQDVHQEAADELVCRKCHELVPLGTLDPVVLVFEPDAHRVSCDQAAIGDGDAMRVARARTASGPPNGFFE